MTSRERILAVLAGEQPDRIPWVPLCSPRYFFSLPEYKRRFPPDWQGSLWPAPSGTLEEEVKFRVDFYRSVGADFMSWGEAGGVQADTFHMRTIRHPDVEFTQSRQDDRITTEVRTPVGVIRRVVGWLPETFTAYAIEHPMKGPDDWRAQAYVLGHAVVESDAERTQRTLDTIGEHGVAFVGFPGSPVMTWLMGDFSVEEVTYALADDSPEIQKLEEVWHDYNLRVCRMLAQDPGKVFCNMAVLGTAMVSPGIVRSHYLPYLKQYLDILRKAGKFPICHASGEPVGHILDVISDLAPFALYGIRQFPTPDAPGMIELREALSDQVVLAGGIDPDFLYRASPAEIEEETKRLLDALADKPSVILATADDVVYGTPPENLEAVSRAVESLG